MPIINWNDAAARYPELASLKDATQAGCYYLPYAIAEIESRLATKFTVPFSSNNLTAKDLMIDATYLKVYRWKADPKKIERIEKHLDDRIKALLGGVADMSLSDGTTLVSIGGTVFSTTEAYHPVFGMGPIEDAVVNSAMIDAEENARL